MTDPRQAPSAGEHVVFLLDCDNTLLDNDALKDDLDGQLRELLGDDLNLRFWERYEQVREEEDTVDLPRTFELFREDCPDKTVIARLRSMFMDYPFETRLYPASLATLAHLRAMGTPVILSDGDNVYQPLKIQRSGLGAAVNGHVLIYIHKEEHLDEVMMRWPASFYVIVDDKPRILAEVKRREPGKFVSVWVRQGHYADRPGEYQPKPDITLASIDELRAFELADFRARLVPET